MHIIHRHSPDLLYPQNRFSVGKPLVIHRLNFFAFAGISKAYRTGRLEKNLIPDVGNFFIGDCVIRTVRG